MVESFSNNLGDLISFEHVYPVGSVLSKDNGLWQIKILAYEIFEGVEKVKIEIWPSLDRHTHSQIEYKDLNYLIDCENN